MKIYVKKEDSLYELVDGSFQCVHEDVTPDYEENLYICDSCDETVDGNPRVDRAETIADLAYDLERER